MAVFVCIDIRGAVSCWTCCRIEQTCPLTKVLSSIEFQVPPDIDIQWGGCVGLVVYPRVKHVAHRQSCFSLSTGTGAALPFQSNKAMANQWMSIMTLITPPHYLLTKVVQTCTVWNWAAFGVSVCRSTMINGHDESSWFGDLPRRNLGTLSCAFEFLAPCNFHALHSWSLIYCRGGLRSVLKAAPSDRLQETGGLSLRIDLKRKAFVAVYKLLHGHAAITHYVGCKIQTLHIQAEKIHPSKLDFGAKYDCLTPESNSPAWPTEGAAGWWPRCWWWFRRRFGAWRMMRKAALWVVEVPSYLVI